MLFVWWKRVHGVLFCFQGLFSGQFQRSTFCGSTMVCWSNAHRNPAFPTGRNTRKSIHAWRKFINTTRLHNQRCASDGTGRWNEIGKSLGLGPYSTGIKSKSNRMSAISFHPIDQLHTNIKSMHIKIETTAHLHRSFHYQPQLTSSSSSSKHRQFVLKSRF